MPSTQKKQVMLAIVAFSILLVIAYDVFHIWKNRPKACDLLLRNCSGGLVCSAPDKGLRGRCIPRSSEPQMSFDVPFLPGAPIQCLRGPQDGEMHSTDFDLFGLRLRASAPSELKLAEELKTTVVAGAEGTAFVLPELNEVRVLHTDGYYSAYRPLKTIAAKDGPIQSGDIIGTVDEPLEMSVHYINPSSAEEILKTSRKNGISVPFRLRLKEQIVPAGDLICGDNSDTRLFRSSTP